MRKVELSCSVVSPLTYSNTTPLTEAALGGRNAFGVVTEVGELISSKSRCK